MKNLTRAPVSSVNAFSILFQVEVIPFTKGARPVHHSLFTFFHIFSYFQFLSTFFPISFLVFISLFLSFVSFFPFEFPLVILVLRSRRSRGPGQVPIGITGEFSWAPWVARSRGFTNYDQVIHQLYQVPKGPKLFEICKILQQDALRIQNLVGFFGHSGGDKIAFHGFQLGR